MADHRWQLELRRAKHRRWAEIIKGERDVEASPRLLILASAAAFGLLEGDLKPLEAYLCEAKGHPLSEPLRLLWIEAIRGEGEFRLEMRKTRRGAGTLITKVETAARDEVIGMFIEEWLPANNDQVESAIAAAMKEFGVKHAVAMAAWSKFKRESS